MAHERIEVCDPREGRIELCKQKIKLSSLALGGSSRRRHQVPPPRAGRTSLPKLAKNELNFKSIKLQFPLAEVLDYPGMGCPSSASPCPLSLSIITIPSLFSVPKVPRAPSPAAQKLLGTGKALCGVPWLVGLNESICGSSVMGLSLLFYLSFKAAQQSDLSSSISL